MTHSVAQEMTIRIHACRVEQASEMRENETAGTSAPTLARPDRRSFPRQGGGSVHRMHARTACEESHADCNETRA